MQITKLNALYFRSKKPSLKELMLYFVGAGHEFIEFRILTQIDFKPIFFIGGTRYLQGIENIWLRTLNFYSNPLLLLRSLARNEFFLLR